MNKKLIIAGLILLTALSAGIYLHKKNKSVSKKTSVVSVYFVKATSPKKEKTVLVSRKNVSKKSSLAVSINELLQGPTLQEKKLGYYTEIPTKTTVISIKETPDSYVIDLSKDFESGGGSESMSKRVEQLEKTAIKNAGEKSVYLEIAGKKVKSIGGEGVEITQPLYLKKGKRCL